MEIEPIEHPAVQLLVKDQYGNKVLYPCNREAATFAAIAGTKTITLSNVKLIMELGYSVEYIHQGVEL